MCRRKAGEGVKRKRARDDRKGEELLLFFVGIPSGSLFGGEKGGGGGGGGDRATVRIDLVSDYHFISRCLLDVITQFDVAEIACEHQRKG